MKYFRAYAVKLKKNKNKFRLETNPTNDKRTQLLLSFEILNSGL